MLNDPNRRYDGFTSLQRGMDSGNAPDSIGGDQVAWAVNVTFRGGKPATRPPLAGIPLTFSDTTTEIRFNTGIVQGACIYQYPMSAIIIARGGRLFKCDLTKDNLVTDISVRTYDEAGVATWDLNADKEFAFLFQAEQFVLVFQGQHRPIIHNGSTSRRAVTGEFPACYCGAYINGRIWAALANRRDYIAGDLVGGDSGTDQYNYKDAILKVTENDYLNEGGAFATPASLGEITAIVGTAQLDTSLGQGPVAIFTTNGVFTNQSPIDRTVWKDLQYPIQTQSLLEFGSLGARSAVPANGDIWYRSTDGWRSWIIGRRNFNQGWANTPMSLEITRLLARDTEALLEFGSAITFDNRLLATCTPHRTSSGIIHRGFAVLSFDQTSSMYSKDDPAWEGLWTSCTLQATQVLAGRIGKLRRAFVINIAASGATEILEILKDGIQDTHATQTSNVVTRSIERIECVLETRQMDYSVGGSSPFELKRLRFDEIFVRDVMGQVDFDVKWRPDDHPCWVNWHTWSECNTITPCEDECPIVDVHRPGYRPFMRTPEAHEVCDSATGRLMHLGYAFQHRLAWTGKATITRLRSHAKPMLDESMGECRDNTYPNRVFWNAAQTAECPEGYIGDSVTIPAHTVSSGVSQADANALALAQAQSQLSCTSIYDVWTNTEQSYTAQCPPLTQGDSVTITIPAGTYTSYISQEAADAIALAAAQSAASAALVCSQLYYNTEQSYTATCPAGQTGVPVTVTKAAGAYSSTVSQEAANAAALAAATAEAEAALSCAYYNTEQSYTATCQGGQIGDPVTVTKAAGTYSSTISQAAADAAALAAATAEALAALVCTDPGGGGSEDYVSSLWAYYPMEDSGAAGQITDTGGSGYDVAQYDPDPADIPSVAGKINNAVNQNLITFRTASNGNFEFYGQDFTIRCWVKVAVSQPPDADVNVIARGSYQLVWTTFDGTIQWSVACAGNPTQYIYSASALSTGVWHRIIAWYKESTHEIGLRIDQDVAVTSIMPAEMTAAASARLWFEGTPYQGNDPAPDLYLDEVAFWKGYALSDDDMTYDWNSGDGRGQPA